MLAIETKGLTKYYGRSRGIIELDLQVREGEIYGFIGPNGAGKSTTIRLLLNFIYPTSGSGKIFGKDCIKDTLEIKRDIGYIPPEVLYYDDMTVHGLLEYSATFYKKDCKKRMHELAEIFELDIERPIDDLSLGNRKKVAIIQAIQHRPKLLIMDEPTSGLDPLMQSNFFKVLEEEREAGASIFFSSHVLSEVQRLCDRVGIIKEGKLMRVEDIETLSKSRFRKVRIEFKGTIQPLSLQGIQDFKSHDNFVEFLFGGDIKELLNHLAKLDIENLWLQDPPLEEIFMHYYEKEA